MNWRPVYHGGRPCHQSGSPGWADACMGRFHPSRGEGWSGCPIAQSLGRFRHRQPRAAGSPRDEIVCNIG
ncbi:MAG: hypothetical protein OZSIB_3718 [Candidatus Ozemobacter sibiricus]|uniref:Uncharacterized protein n=1 Tax=Candidatus Ozemobacter sibiricus TaxID=2268124 RepID=A0A367ZCE8_9BACT|nr:MAG: hypothetical protein OZSIB_3718 [Candidatus Ozemobacter sibiricus]